MIYEIFLRGTGEVFKVESKEELQVGNLFLVDDICFQVELARFSEDVKTLYVGKIQLSRCKRVNENPTRTYL